MCAIVGWNTKIPKQSDLEYILSRCNSRGRDGWGFRYNNTDVRGIEQISDNIINKLHDSKYVVGNFRATPTTEIETQVDGLQPYDGFVHNGTIANDKDISDIYRFKKPYIDSMIFPHIIPKAQSYDDIYNSILKITGSYAVAFFDSDNKLHLFANYKPIYISHINNGIVFASMDYMYHLLVINFLHTVIEFMIKIN